MSGTTVAQTPPSPTQQDLESHVTALSASRVGDLALPGVQEDGELPKRPSPSLATASTLDVNGSTSDSASSTGSTGSQPDQKCALTAWSREFWSLGFSAIALAALIGLLAGCQNRAPPQLPLSMTINALVSILIGILYISLASPLNSCLSQLKWNHFSDARRLSHFQKIDSASRSILGSAKVLAMTPANPIVFFAAVLVISIQAIGPFVQQIVSVDLQDVIVSNNATVPLSWTWSDHEDQLDAQGCGGDVACMMVHAYDKSTRYALERTPVQPVCPFANCSWEPYWTLAICSQCEDISHLVGVVDRSTGQPSRMSNLSTLGSNVWTLPNGHYLDPSIRIGSAGAVIGNLINITATQNQTMASVSGDVLAKITILSTPLTLDPVALECTLQFCGQHIQGQVVNGTFSEDVQETVYFPDADYAWDEYGVRAATNMTFQPEDITSSVMVVNSSGTSLNLTVDGAAFMKVAERLAFGLTGFLEVPDNPSTSYTVMSTGDYGWYRAFDPVFNAMYNAIQEDWRPGTRVSNMDTVLQQPASRGSIQADALRERIETIASVLTNTVRSNGELAHGQGRAYQLFVQVAWSWISLPLALLVLSTGVLFWTIFDTRRKEMNVWSNDALAGIVHGTDVATQGKLRHEDTSKGLWKASTEMRVRLGDYGKIKSLTAVARTASVSFPSNDAPRWRRASSPALGKRNDSPGLDKPIPRVEQCKDEPNAARDAHLDANR